MKKIIALILTVLTFYVSNAQWVDPSNNGTGNIYYTNGNVGVGTNNPTEKLDIRGRLKVGEDDEFNVVLGYDFFGDDISMVHEGGGVIFSVDANGAGVGYGGEGSNRTMWLDNGRVGVGTSSPTEKLEIKGNLKIAPDEDYNMTLGYSLFGGDDISMVHQLGGVVFYVDDDGQSIGYGGVGNNRTMWLKNDNVGIGTSAPQSQFHATGVIRAGNFRFNSNGHIIDDARYDNYILSWNWDSNYGDHTKVNWGGNGAGTDLIISQNKGLIWDGKFTTEEVKVEVVDPPDFVFAPNYNLMPLTQIEAYIKANHHLPEVPSAAEMEANGIELGKMNMLLLQKIEELTLYQIEMNKLLIKQHKEINKLKNSIK